MKQWQLVRREDGGVSEANAGVEGEFSWCHLDGRDPEAIAWLEKQSGIPDAAVRALAAAETRPRVEIFDGGALINLRGLGTTPEDDPDALVSIRLWAEAGRVVSVSFRTLLGIEAVREEMSEGRLADPGDLITSLASNITGRLDPHIADLGDVIDECETHLNPNQAFAMRRRIGSVRSDAIGYRRFVTPQRQALERLAGLMCGWLNDDDRMHLREAADRFARMAEELEAIRERSALLHEQLTDLRAEMLDTRALLLSIVALIFLPLTFITGLLGMNVDGIPYAHEPWSFWGVVGFCVVVAAVITGYFVKARWSGR